jgi:hypothetical protein
MYVLRHHKYIMVRLAEETTGVAGSRNKGRGENDRLFDGLTDTPVYF